MKSKKQMSPREIADAVNKELAKSKCQGRICMANQTTDRKIVKRPTGIASLDVALAGGFPGSTINVIGGQDGVGKDTLMNQIIKTHQRLYGENASVFINHNEPGGYDKVHARRHGVQISLSESEINNVELALERKLTEEQKQRLRRQIGTFYFSDSKVSAEVFDTILKLEALGACSLFFINSLTNLLPEWDENEEVGEAKASGVRNAQITTDFLKRWGKVGTGVESGFSTVIVIMQARANMSGYKGWGGKEWTTKYGAHSLLHAKCMDVTLQNIGKITEGQDETRRVLGKRIRWELAKAKYGTHDGIRGEFSLVFQTGIDVFEDMVDTMISLNMARITDRSTGKMAIEVNGKVMASGGRGDIVNRLREDQTLFSALYSAAMHTLREPFLVRPPE